MALGCWGFGKRDGGREAAVGGWVGGLISMFCMIKLLLVSILLIKSSKFNQIQIYDKIFNKTPKSALSSASASTLTSLLQMWLDGKLCEGKIANKLGCSSQRSQSDSTLAQKNNRYIF